MTQFLKVPHVGLGILAALTGLAITILTALHDPVPPELTNAFYALIGMAGVAVPFQGPGALTASQAAADTAAVAESFVPLTQAAGPPAG